MMTLTKDDWEMLVRESELRYWTDSSVRGKPIWLAVYPSLIDVGELRNMCISTCLAWTSMPPAVFDERLRVLREEALLLIEPTLNRLREYGEFVTLSTLRQAPNGAPYIQSSAIPKWRLR